MINTYLYKILYKYFKSKFKEDRGLVPEMRKKMSSLFGKDVRIFWMVSGWKEGFLCVVLCLEMCEKAIKARCEGRSSIR